MASTVYATLAKSGIFDVADLFRESLTNRICGLKRMRAYSTAIEGPLVKKLRP